MNLDQYPLSKDVVKEICEARQISEKVVLKHGEFNHSVADVVFNFLEHKGINVTNVTSTYGYFLFYFYPNSVYHFNVKGLSKKWKFGMWIHDVECCISKETNVLVEVFCQHEDKIDKFKPSASDILVQLSYNDFVNTLNNNVTGLDTFVHNIKKAVKFIKIHPLLAYVGYTSYYFMDYHPTKVVLDDKLYKAKVNASKYVLTKLCLNRINKLLTFSIVNNVKFSFDKGCYPSRCVDVYLDSECSDDEVCDMVNKVFPLKYPKDLSWFGYANFEFTFHKGKEVYRF